MLLVAEMPSSGRVVARALPVDQAGSVPLEPDEGRWFALFYECSLAELEISSGDLTLVKAAGLRRLPRPGRLLGREGGSPAWKEIEGWPEPLASLSLEQPPLRDCVQFRVRVFPVRTSSETAALSLVLPLDGGRVLIGAESDELFVYEGGHVTALDKRMPALGGYRTERGEIWLAGRRGRLAHGTSVDDLELAGTSSLTMTRGGLRRVTGTRDGGPFEMVIVDGDGNTEWWNGADSWLVIDRSSGQDHDGRPAVIRRGPRDLLISGSRALVLTQWVDGVLSEVEFQDRSGFASPTALADVPGLGTLVGTNIGSIFVERERNRGWQEMPGPFGDVVRGLIPFRDGYLFAGILGVIGQVTKDGTECQMQSVASGLVADMAALGAGFVLISNSEISIPRGVVAVGEVSEEGDTRAKCGR